MSVSSRTAYFITHPDVSIDPAVPVTDWPLSPRGRQRMVRALARPWVHGIRAVWCSSERKAREGADILASHLNLAVTELPGLGENDRSATGYLPRAEFEAVADEFFANPAMSVRGWERAVDAQRRIVGAVGRALAGSATCGGDVAIVAHGGVGPLLLCHLPGVAISRAHDQPPNNGSNFFTFGVGTWQVHQGWRPIDELPAADTKLPRPRDGYFVPR
jgi:broad specificity phosphatase PhoE